MMAISWIGVAVLSTVFGGGGMALLPLGMPPGERHAPLQSVVPDSCLLYHEWSLRTDGKPGAAGLDGLVADPEIGTFIEDAERALSAALVKNSGEDGPALRRLFPLVRAVTGSAGCAFVSCRLDDLPPREDSPNVAILMQRLQVGLVLHMAADPDGFEQHVLNLLALTGSAPGRLNRYIAPIPIPGGGLTLHRHDTYFSLTYGGDTLDAVLLGLKGERDGLAADERVQQALDAVNQKRTGRWFWLDLAGLRTVADVVAGSSSMIAEVSEILGVHRVEHFTATVGVDDAGRISTKSHARIDGERTGLLSLFSGRALKPADFSHIPGDADLVIATSVDHKRVFDAFRAMVAGSDPQASERLTVIVGEIEREIGLRLEDDLMAAFGEVWTVYDSPSIGGVLPGSPVFAVEVKDTQKAYEAFTQLMGVLQRALPGVRPIGDSRYRRGIQLEQRKFFDRTLYYVNVVGEDIAVAPSVYLTKSHLLLALHPQPLKAHVRFLATDAPRFSERLAGETPIESAHLMSLGYLDSEVAARYLTAVSPWVGQIALSELQPEGATLDLSSVPSAQALLPYVSDSWGWLEVSDSGVTGVSHCGMPIPGLTTGGALLSPMLMYFRFGLVRVVDDADRVD